MTTNTDRIHRAVSLVDYYRANYCEADSEDEAITDIIADLLHYAREVGEDPYRMLSLAQMHYEAETELCRGTVKFGYTYLGGQYVATCDACAYVCAYWEDGDTFEHEPVTR